jgi:hypothetical protein
MARVLVGLGEDVLHRIEVLVLSRAAAKGHDERTILRAHNVAQIDPHHFWPSMRLRPSGLLVVNDQRNCWASEVIWPLTVTYHRTAAAPVQLVEDSEVVPIDVSQLISVAEQTLRGDGDAGDWGRQPASR